MFAPGQINPVPLEVVMIAGGLGLLMFVTITGVAVEEQPPALKTVTLYVPAALTVMADVVSPPGDHTYEVPPEAVSVTVSPGSNAVGPLTLMFATGIAFTVTVVAADVAEHPPTPVTCTL